MVIDSDRGAHPASRGDRVLIPFRVVIDSDRLAAGGRHDPEVLIPFRVVIDSDTHTYSDGKWITKGMSLNTLSGGHRFRHYELPDLQSQRDRVLIPFRVVIDSDTRD